MSSRIKGGIFVGILLVVLGIAYQVLSPRFSSNKNPSHYSLLDRMEKEGVPSFQLARLDGSPFRWDEVGGKIVIVNFWASWCNPCVQEFPSMIKLVERFGGEVKLVAVSTDDEKQDIEMFMKAFGLPKSNIEVVWDKEKSVMKLYGVDRIPESFLVGRDQKLIRKVVGIEDWYTDGAISYFETLVGKR